MERTYIAQALTMAGQTVKVQGFVENNRNGKSMAFIVLKDITGKMQITVEKEKHPVTSAPRWISLPAIPSLPWWVR